MAKRTTDVNKQQEQKKQEQEQQEEKQEEQSQQEQLTFIQEMLDKVKGKLRDKDLKATLADYIRLMQLLQELRDEQPREVKVQWVEPRRSRAGRRKEESAGKE
jgi:hypothetical protein